tara:strand:+ start:7699 stop:7938 length:240 start_codon:yes stop_codon:yes gene_type:complete
MNNNIYYIIAAAIVVVFITALVVVLSINRGGTCQLDETATNCTEGVSGWDGICRVASTKTQCLAFGYGGQKCCKWVNKK